MRRSSDRVIHLGLDYVKKRVFSLPTWYAPPLVSLLVFSCALMWGSS